jgi:hypothetical protein
MTPGQTLIFLIFWAAIVVAGYHLGKYKGHTGTACAKQTPQYWTPCFGPSLRGK